MWWVSEDGVGGLCGAEDGSVCMADGESGLFGDCEAPSDFRGGKVDEDGLGMDRQEVGSCGEGDCNTGGLRGDVGVEALAVGEGVQLEEGGWVG